ncbi:MAG: EAL domain-containing protein [Betaproteobacteria bacterium]|nr:MAG: EAL domain-containing protein [Betaproteobacteria bacterium]
MKQRRQNAEVEELVRERTHELEETSAALELDVAARERSEKLLHESEHRFRSLTELSADWYWEQDENLRFTFLSSTVYERSGCSAAHTIGKTRWEIPDTVPLSSAWPEHRATLAARQAFRDFEYRRVGEDGALRFISVSGLPLVENGKFSGYRGIGRDITEQKLALDKVRESQENLAAAQRIAHLGSWELDLGDLRDLDRNPLRWSDETFRIFGYQPREIDVSNENFFNAVHPDDKARIREEVARAVNDGTSYSIEHRIIRPDGCERIIQELSGIVYDAISGKPVKMVGTVQDVTERKRSEERLAYLAWFDSLTGLPNRHRLHDDLTQMLAQPQQSAGRIGCMIAKLDHFKDVNSIYGRRAGDQLLVEAAERLRRNARDSDTVGRLGDDEFVILLSKLATADDAGLVARKIIDALAAPFNLGGLEIHISANIGIAIYPGDGDDPEGLLKNADAAMHRAKEQGRNTFRFYLPRMNELALERLQLHARLRGALERKEFVLHYQPKVDLTTGIISGLEALLRWQHPERGRMAPAEFVPILEETGLIAPVGEWVLQTVCEQIKAWQARGITVRPVAVNLSAQQFHQADFDAHVRVLITQSGVDCRLIELEITESMLMHDPAEAASMLNRLRRIGVKVSIDDFGTGYSSLAYLKRFPLDALKIDRTFVRDLTVDSDDAEIAVAIISLAHNLKLKVVAEGVETEAQLNFLRSHGCDEMQGYYFARPLSVEDCTRTLIENRRLDFPKSRIALRSARIFRADAEHIDGPTSAAKRIELADVELEWLRRCSAHVCAAPTAVVAALERAGFAILDDVGRLNVTNTGRDYISSHDSQIRKRRRKRN